MSRKVLIRRESMMEDSNMLTPLDLETLPRGAAALRRLLMQRELEHAAEHEQQQRHSSRAPLSCKRRATACRN
jgi:hypothetical protein